MWKVTGIVVLLGFCGSVCQAGECCVAYSDDRFVYHGDIWCSDYCCVGRTCCDNIQLQAPWDSRESMCPQWWADHVWVPVLIAVGILLSIIGCIACCCCCCFCCRRNKTTVIYSQQGAQAQPTFTENIGNVPFASLIAILIVFVGVGVFCGTLYRALSIILTGVMQELFEFNVTWLEVLQIVFIVIALVMALFAILLLIFGFLATGATRQNVYSGAKCIMGGRVSAAFFMVISYLLNLAWLLIMSMGVIPIIFYISIHSICKMDIYSKDAQSLNNYCFSLTQFGIYRNQSYPMGIQPPGRERLCGHAELRRFCDRIEEAGPLFCVAYAGAFFICLGMIHFMISLAANYTRIRISKDMTQYRDAADLEELELNSNMDKTSSQQY